MPLLKKAFQLAKHPKRFPEALFHIAMSQARLRKLLYRYVDWRDQCYIKQTNFSQVPPASLRFRVHGDLNIQSFLETGRRCSHDIRDALARVCKDMNSFRHILDFGCGCGRTIIWFSSSGNSVNLYGTDIDAAAIEWCRRYLDFATFKVNRPLPPLSYQANSFDFVYAISVFTHLNQDYQFRWLQELRRLTKPMGYVLLTLHGSYYWSRMQPREIEEIRKTGFLFVQGPQFMQGLFPEWYQNAYHTQEYVFSKYSKYFNVLEYIPHGLDNCQDVVLLQKP
jgi:ubiquinone/menaquinone biosynthesis C-methylase UbiE